VDGPIVVSGVSSIPLTPHDFILGSENRLLEMAIAALRGGAIGTSLLVVCGPAGSGKSHLARGVVAWACGPCSKNESGAVATELKIHDTSGHGLGSPCYLLDAESLRRALADHRQPERLAAWRQQVRAAALVVFDGVDELAGQDSAQREFASLIDAVQDNGGRLLITSRCFPISTAPLDPRLISRLEAGLAVNIAPPQRAAREALLTAFARQQQIQLQSRVAAALVETQHASPGDMLSALSRVSTVSEELTPTDLKEMLEPGNSSRPRMATIVAAVARHYRLSPDDLRGRSRRRTVAMARSMAMYLCRQLGGSHLHLIGKYLGGRDHTTVLHGCQKIRELLETDATVRAECIQLRRTLTGQRRGRSRRGQPVGQPSTRRTP